MVNVIAVFQNFSSTYYSYNNFGEFIIEELDWEKDSRIFPNRMRNLRGVTLPALFGGHEPSVIVSENFDGEIVIGGLVGHIFKALAKKHNARLNTSNIDLSLSPLSLYQFVLNGSLEIAAAGPVALMNPNEWFSYPYRIYDWGVMLPIESNIPISKVFVSVFYWDSFLITIMVLIILSMLLRAAELTKSQRPFTKRDIFFINLDGFRGILGQSFSVLPSCSKGTKIIYSLIFLLGIIIVTSYDAFLQSFMTQPPREKMIKSFEMLQSSGIKIYCKRTDIEGFLEDNFKTFIEVRDSLNTKYAYTLNEDNWQLYKNQQNFFGQQLFRWSDELCLLNSIQSAIAINENSIYKKILNFLIMETQSAGLLDYWIGRAFYELVEVGRIKKLNYGFKGQLQLQPMKLEDLKWIWMSLGLAFFVDTLCFVGEIFLIET
ncbi:uncharacterized protein LOC129915114 [Episyrphus balteatus]|uniref:uncharacterized protein LOC129915114 n=1 Tax=Episyrphus balteatus TaxID=286459 RepID=UPI0024851485|nr:uncharacterized protein LOC129915114 [Episyrphus balteatus]